MHGDIYTGIVTAYAFGAKNHFRTDGYAGKPNHGLGALSGEGEGSTVQSTEPVPVWKAFKEATA
jgi:hypothetical protein